MFWPLERSHVLVLAGCIVLVALATIVTKLVARVVLGKDWAAPRVKVPWRFSLLAIAVLTAIFACVLGLLRDKPDVAMLSAAIVLFLWFPIARFLEFRQMLADRRKKELAALLAAKGGNGHEGP